MRFPAQIDSCIAGWACALAWESGPGSSTWKLSSADGQHRYLKTRPADAAVTLGGETARMRWARAAGLPVPDVVTACRLGSADWLLTEALPGRSAVDPALKYEPETLVSILARGLRQFHDLVPAGQCPFPFRIDDAIARVSGRVQAGLISAPDMHPEHAHLSPEAALAELERLRPRTEDLVVCHGDYCLPNVLITDGVATGFVDLGELGVADRWWDLAVGSWSVTWNLGPGWEDLFLSSYGVTRDDHRVAFYRLLYDLTS